jgi:endonuclease/exonuclease/phosphatase family metal-dependent hydrolase
MGFKILFSNIGYAKGIDGSLWAHLRHFNRYFYSGVTTQKKILGQIKALVDQEKPDLCCFVEIDRGSIHSARYNQMEALVDEHYAYHDIAGKYGEEHWLSTQPFHSGKSNGFLSQIKIDFDKLYFKHGSKRLLYKLSLPNNVTLLFAHFSLSAKTRAKQFHEVNALVRSIGGEIVLLADFNIMQGFSELKPLMEGTNLKILNLENQHTFIFHRYSKALDLCLCTEKIAEKAALRIIPQPFSDHAALLVEI